MKKDRDRKETGWEEIKRQDGDSLKSLTREDRWIEDQRWSERPAGWREKERKEKKRVNASCFLMRPIFNQHCLCSSNNHRKLARLEAHQVWMALLFLAHSFFCCPNPLLDDFLRGVSFSLKEKKNREQQLLFFFSWQDIPSVCLCSVSSLFLIWKGITIPLNSSSVYRSRLVPLFPFVSSSISKLSSNLFDLNSSIK